MEPRTGAILCFVGFFVTFVLFLTCFGAPYWEDNELLHSGVWRSCIKITGRCVDNVEAMDLADKGGIARGIQALMCLALIAGLAAGVANIFWIIEPETDNIGIATCVCIMIAGLLTGIAVALYSMLYSESIDLLSMLTGAGGQGGSHIPSGWAFYVAIACTTIFEVLGMLCCCCACQGASKTRVDPGYHHGYGRTIHPHDQNSTHPYHIQRPPLPKTLRSHGHSAYPDEGYSYPLPLDPVQPPPYDYRTDPPPYKPN